jgi:hypothetical protein
MFLEVKSQNGVAQIEIELMRPAVLDVGVQFNGFESLFFCPIFYQL